MVFCCESANRQIYAFSWTISVQKVAAYGQKIFSEALMDPPLFTRNFGERRWLVSPVSVQRVNVFVCSRVAVTCVVRKQSWKRTGEHSSYACKDYRGLRTRGAKVKMARPLAAVPCQNRNAGSWEFAPICRHNGTTEWSCR